MKFAIVSFLILVMAAQALWSIAIEDRLYRCSDETGFGFLAPGDWYHPPYDWIAEGWSNDRLWILWIAMVAGVIVSSCVSGYLMGRHFRGKARIAEQDG